MRTFRLVWAYQLMLPCFFSGVGLGKESWGRYSMGIALGGPSVVSRKGGLLSCCPALPRGLCVPGQRLWLLETSTLCLPVQSRQGKYNGTCIVIGAALVSWMRNHLGLIQFHQEDFIPGSGAVLGGGFEPAKPRLCFSSSWTSDTCLPMGRMSRPLAGSPSARHGCETAHVLICEIGCLALSQPCTYSPLQTAGLKYMLEFKHVLKCFLNAGLM